ncbi:PREDICTED: NKG2D ligand 1-like [Elephantulus edwardii]|uniref:NKG2D ligand 1-like n=1 Tax=Elephantulus edwardii TaxID=28737 RepID=UPI0003F0B45D|nr:PREDICTED: NKG2D ligand 1-like [Elephantulus edwardii]
MAPMQELAHANTTKAWAEQTETLKDLEPEFRILLLDVKLEDFIITDPPTLQVKLFCQQEAKQCTSASWQFSINGQPFLLIDTANNKWIISHPGATHIKEKWQKDREFVDHFWKISLGDCNYWLREFLVCRENMLESTGN